MKKRWHKSKLNWLGIAQVAMGAASIISTSPDAPEDWKSVALIVSGVLTMILRTWFTK